MYPFSLFTLVSSAPLRLFVHRLPPRHRRPQPTTTSFHFVAFIRPHVCLLFRFFQRTYTDGKRYSGLQKDAGNIRLFVPLRLVFRRDGCCSTFANVNSSHTHLRVMYRHEASHNDRRLLVCCLFIHCDVEEFLFLFVFLRLLFTETPPVLTSLTKALVCWTLSDVLIKVATRPLSSSPNIS